MNKNEALCKATTDVRKRMLEMLIGYEECQHLPVGVVREIAGWAEGLALTAIKEAERLVTAA